MIYGYARVSTQQQDNALQLVAMKRAGVRKVVEEKRSGGAARPLLEALLTRLKPGDTVVVYKVDRLARSLVDLLRILHRITEAGAAFRSLTEPIETATPVGRMMLQLLGAVAEFERAVIRERCEAGRRAARDRGVQFGRPPLLTKADLERLASKPISMMQGSVLAGVSYSAMKYAVRRHGVRFSVDGRGARLS